MKRLVKQKEEKTKMKIYSILTLSALLLSGCAAPLIIGGGAAIGTMAVREKGIGGTITDSEISLRIKGKYYKYNVDLHAHVGLNVQNGEVLLTGALPQEDWTIEAERLAWQVRGVKSVLNNTTVMQNPKSINETFGSVPQDSWITTAIKSKLLFNQDVKSLNYSIKTVDQIVYIMGVGQTQEEIDTVVHVASNVSGVKKVVNYAQIMTAAGEARNDNDVQDPDIQKNHAISTERDGLIDPDRKSVV